MLVPEFYFIFIFNHILYPLNRIFLLDFCLTWFSGILMGLNFDQDFVIVTLDRWY